MSRSRSGPEGQDLMPAAWSVEVSVTQDRRTAAHRPGPGLEGRCFSRSQTPAAEPRQGRGPCTTDHGGAEAVSFQGCCCEHAKNKPRAGLGQEPARGARAAERRDLGPRRSHRRSQRAHLQPYTVPPAETPRLHKIGPGRYLYVLGPHCQIFPPVKSQKPRPA